MVNFFKILVVIQVSYYPNDFGTSEGVGKVELNISVYSHRFVGALRPFTLSVSTQDGTAGIYDFK